MKNWFKIFIDTLLPPRCLLCGKVIHHDDSLCSECFKNITFITHPYCQYCGSPLPEDIFNEACCVHCLKKKPPFRMCRSAVIYDDYSKHLVLDFKFADHTENKNLLARWLLLAGEDIFHNGVDVIIPVPLHFRRLFKRKYNQSAMLAAELSMLSHIPAEFTALKKIRHTTPQVHCNGKQRLKNIKDAFEVTALDKVKGKRILLIDDVYTTGATLRECARVLKKAGAKSVDAITVARVYKQ
jgi:ComF family protein